MTLRWEMLQQLVALRAWGEIMNVPAVQLDVIIAKAKKDLEDRQP